MVAITPGVVVYLFFRTDTIIALNGDAQAMPAVARNHSYAPVGGRSFRRMTGSRSFRRSMPSSKAIRGGASVKARIDELADAETDQLEAAQLAMRSTKAAVRAYIERFERRQLTQPSSTAALAWLTSMLKRNEA
jgi:hypothetical protein